jgi:hypothetical protein
MLFRSIPQGQKGARLNKLLFVMAFLSQIGGGHAANAGQALFTTNAVVLPKPDPDGFIALFDGHQLTGWAGLAEYWSVEDGSIRGHESKEKSRQTFLVLTALKPSNFELRFRYRFVSPEGNSGVQFRSVILDQKSFIVGGYQADFDAEARFDGSIYDEAGAAGNRGTMSRRGEKTIWDAENKRHVQPLDATDAELGSFIRRGDWNDVVLSVEGNHVTYKVNGHTMTDLVDESPKALSGSVLALQLHQGYSMDVRFKDLRIKILHKEVGTGLWR